MISYHKTEEEVDQYNFINYFTEFKTQRRSIEFFRYCDKTVAKHLDISVANIIQCTHEAVNDNYNIYFFVNIDNQHLSFQLLKEVATHARFLVHQKI